MLICYGMRIPVVYGLLYPLGALMALYIVAAVDLARASGGWSGEGGCTGRERREGARS